MRRRLTSPTHRLLAAMVGSLFMFSVLTAQLAYCQCGISCLHLPAGPAPEQAPSGMADHGCCPSDPADDAPVSHSQAPAGHHDEEDCPCPVEMSGNDNQLPIGPISTPAQQAQPDVKVQHAALAAVTAPLPRPGFENAARWRPSRGSPLPGTSIHLLNSVLII